MLWLLFFEIYFLVTQRDFLSLTFPRRFEGPGYDTIFTDPYPNVKHVILVPGVFFFAVSSNEKTVLFEVFGGLYGSHE